MYGDVIHTLGSARSRVEVTGATVSTYRIYEAELTYCGRVQFLIAVRAGKELDLIRAAACGEKHIRLGRLVHVTDDSKLAARLSDVRHF